MGGLVTSGLTGPLITVGLGGITVVIVKEDFTTRGSGVGTYWKNRVRGLLVEDKSKLIILQTLSAKSNIPLEIFQVLNLTSDEELHILQRIKKMLENPCEFGITIIKRVDKSITVKQHFITKITGKVSIAGQHFINFVEKQVKIVDRTYKKTGKDTKLLNPRTVIKDIEAIELLELLKKLEETEDND